MSSPHSDVLDGAISTQISTYQIVIQENHLHKKVKKHKTATAYHIDSGYFK